MVDHILIVGAGQAAIQAIDTLRRKGFTGALTLVGDEPYLPYQRPPLSKKFLSGALERDRLLIRPAHFLCRTSHRRPTRAGAPRRSTGQPAAVRLDDGTVLDYDALLLATGSTPRADSRSRSESGWRASTCGTSPMWSASGADLAPDAGS